MELDIIEVIRLVVGVGISLIIKNINILRNMDRDIPSIRDEKYWGMLILLFLYLYLCFINSITSIKYGIKRYGR